MFEIYLIGFIVGVIAGIIGTYFHFESKYIEKLDKPVIHTLTIEIEEDPDGKSNKDSDATRWLESWGS